MARTKLVVIERRPLRRPNGQPVWRWKRHIEGGMVQVQVNEIVCTHVNRGKSYRK